MVTIIKTVELLDSAEEQHISIAPLTEQQPTLTIDDAYHVQLTRIEKKVNDGDVITGKKIGLTSLAMQNLLGVDQPDYGHLLKSMEVKNGGEISLSSLFQPKIEGEIAFVLKQDLVGPNVTVEDVLLATDYVVASIEIVDSRVKDWKIKLEDTIADNASCGLYVLSDQKVKLEDIHLPSISMQLLKNGEVVNTGQGTDVLGNPAVCVQWLANKLHTYNVDLKAGEVILSGALSAAVVAEPGDIFTARFTTLGDVTVEFTE
jgi:2-keto-4-pentenoate hydratase